MDLISMKKQPEREEEGSYDYDEPAYSYGLCIHLGKEELEALGITALPEVGSEMMVHAMAYVKTVSARENQDGNEMSMELQITDMAIEGKERNREAAKGLYGEDKRMDSNSSQRETSRINNIADRLYGA